MKKKVGVLYFDLMKKRGAESVAAWALTALRGEFEVTLITAGRVNVEEFDEHLGTQLCGAEFELRHPGVAIRLLAKLPRFAVMKQAVLNRYARGIAEEFDLVVGLWNELDVGKPSLQYVHIPIFLEAMPPEYLEGMREGFVLAQIRGFYQRVCRRWAKVSAAAITRNVTLANSEWTAGLVRSGYGGNTRVLYPPVVTSGNPPLPWKDRENGFVCVGALVPGKNILRNIGIVSRLREAGHDVHLHIVGSGRKKYAREVQRVASERADYIFLEGSPSRDKLLALLRAHRYGIHGCNFEHFGVAVAEMVCEGCIVFVPDGGGQVEIVNHSQLVYGSLADAVNKIGTVLSDTELQSKIVSHLGRSAHLYSPERFMEEFSSAVRVALAAASSEEGQCHKESLQEVFFASSV